MAIEIKTNYDEKDLIEIRDKTNMNILNEISEVKTILNKILNVMVKEETKKEKRLTLYDLDRFRNVTSTS